MQTRSGHFPAQIPLTVCPEIRIQCRLHSVASEPLLASPASSVCSLQSLSIPAFFPVHQHASLLLLQGLWLGVSSTQNLPSPDMYLHPSTIPIRLKPSLTPRRMLVPLHLLSHRCFAMTLKVAYLFLCLKPISVLPREHKLHKHRDPPTSMLCLLDYLRHLELCPENSRYSLNTCRLTDSLSTFAQAVSSSRGVKSPQWSFLLAKDIFREAASVCFCLKPQRLRFCPVTFLCCHY